MNAKHTQLLCMTLKGKNKYQKLVVRLFYRGGSGMKVLKAVEIKVTWANDSLEKAMIKWNWGSRIQ